MFMIIFWMSLSIITLGIILIILFLEATNKQWHKDPPPPTLFIFLAILVLILFLSTNITDRCIENNFLIENGVMHYVVNPQTGKISLEWNDE